MSTRRYRPFERAPHKPTIKIPDVTWSTPEDLDAEEDAKPGTAERKDRLAEDKSQSQERTVPEQNQREQQPDRDSGESTREAEGGANSGVEPQHAGRNTGKRGPQAG